MGKRILLAALAMLLWLASTVLGVIAMLQVYEATRVVAAFVIPIDPEWTVAHGPQVEFVTRVILFILALSLLAVAILLLEKYLDATTEPRRLARWFFVTTTVELTIFGLATAITDMLLGPALDVTP